MNKCYIKTSNSFTRRILRTFMVMKLKTMDNNSKYQAIEKALFTLKLAGYSISDKVYQVLVKERADLEYKKKPSNYEDTFLDNLITNL